MKLIGTITIVCCAVLLQSCASVDSRISKADKLSVNAQFNKTLLQTVPFMIRSFYRISDHTKPVHVYIEGDGLAWVSRYRRSSNPTPEEPLVLTLASLDKAANVVYLARPCQYIQTNTDPNCDPKYWSKSRFSEEVVASMNQAISHFTRQAKTGVHLIGYSGGAAIAALIAARRDDALSLRTVAGNLDHVAINRFHNVDQMPQSLNPIDVAEKLSDLPQHHFIGEEDTIIPEYSVKNFAMRTEAGKGCVKVSSLPGAKHHKGWKENWQRLLSVPLECKKSL